MKFNLPKALLVLCLGIVLIGIVSAEEGQSDTYGAYPGKPTTVVGQPSASSVLPTPVPVVQTAIAQTKTTPMGVVAAYPGEPSSTGAVTAIYSTQAPPADQQKVLLSYNVQASPLSAVYYSGTFMPWTSFYKRFPAKSPALWVASSAGWSWYVTSPVGGWIQNLMYVPYTGTMKLYEFYPDGSIKLYSYGFATPGYKYIWFYADTPGRHITLFTIFDKPSNYITIDVL
jgi:hypothetical protein